MWAALCLVLQARVAAHQDLKLKGQKDRRKNAFPHHLDISVVILSEAKNLFVVGKNETLRGVYPEPSRRAQGDKKGFC